MLLLIGLLCTLSSASGFVQNYLDTVFEWPLIRYDVPPGFPGNGSFRADKSLIFSVEVGFDCIFFTVPRALTDNPASLVWVPKNSEERNPLLQAYPNWDYHAGSAAGQPITENTCKGLISAWKLRVDRCGRLWVLDTGIVYPWSPNREAVCPPKLVAFDLHTHKEVKTVEFRKDVVKVNSLMTNFVIDDTDEFGAEPADKCDVGYIYISDTETPAIIVYDMQTNDMWRHSDPSFFPHPQHSKIQHAGGESIVSSEGIVGMDLSSPGLGANRDLFYNAEASKTIYAVNTEALRNRPNPPYLLELPVRKEAEKSSQSAPLCYDPIENALVFSPWNETTLVSWSRGEKEYRILSADQRILQGVTEIISTRMDGNNIWVVSTKFVKVNYDTVNPNEINQRVLRLIRQYPYPLRSTRSN